ncbi:MAG TPA: polysaccharide deacetylase family protein [Longimicrobiaceae bacterium]|nr:polysaccharide deacetylase family protein [Longimicrobiaceae bacterium]
MTGRCAGLLLLCALAAGCRPDEQPAAEHRPVAARAATAPEPAATRAVAVTFDDLPSSAPYDLEVVRDVNRKLLETIRAHRVPAVGFVVGRGAERAGERGARMEILRGWVDAGLELGSHTYSHMSVSQRPLEEVEADVVRNETVLAEVLGARWEAGPRWFRHPTLATGDDPRERDAYRRFLEARGYTIAPVTFDNQEWVFAAAYDRALERGDTAAARCAAEAYVPYLERTFAYFEEMARGLFGRDIPHVLLLHANRINAEHFGEVAEALRRRGYRFVPLGEALADEAYRSPDGWASRGGPSWLHRWAAGRSQPLRPEPREPELMARLADRARAPGTAVPRDCSALPVPEASPVPQAG